MKGDRDEVSANFRNNRSEILHFCRLVFFAALGVFSAVLLPSDFTEDQRIMTGIFVVAASLWITETIPPFAVAILVIVSCVYLLGQPSVALGLQAEKDYLMFITPLSNPVLVLFFGGFILSIAFTKHGLDKLVAYYLLKPFVSSPKLLLLGTILVTGFFSMFMSNTATAFMMMAILSPLLQRISPGESLRKKLLLAVAFAANIGGIGTIIGTPPNAIAVSALNSIGVKVTFLSWMFVGVPVALTLLLLLWLILSVRVTSRRTESVMVLEKPQHPPHKRGWLVGITFLATIILWMLEGWHGYNPAIVSLLPLTIFTATGLLDASDLKRVDWDVLILVAGGLVLGVGLQTTGLTEKFVSYVSREVIPTGWVILLLSILTILVSNFMSNTSAANIFIPVAVSMSTISPLISAVAVAFSASLAMSLPISTPPNAVVYGSGYLKSRDMLLYGSVVSFCGALLLFLLVYLTTENLLSIN